MLGKHNIILGFALHIKPWWKFFSAKGVCALKQNLPSTSKPITYFFCSFFNFVIVAQVIDRTERRFSQLLL
jgi:hypothetical protein